MTSSLKSPHNSCLAASCKLCAMDSMYKKHSQSDFEKKKKKKRFPNSRYHLKDNGKICKSYFWRIWYVVRNVLCNAFFVLVGLHYYQTFLGVISLKTKDRWMEWCYICKYKEREIILKKKDALLSLVKLLIRIVFMKLYIFDR